MKKILTLLFSFVYCITSAQTPSTVDSLLNKLTKGDADTNKVLLLDKLSYEYSLIDADTGIYYAKEALALAEKLQWKKGIALANCDLAINYQEKFDNVVAMDYAEVALKIYQELGNKDGIAACLANIAHIYTVQGNYSKAIEVFFDALKIYESLNDKKRGAIINENIGTIYKEQNEYNNARIYYTIAFDINKEANDSVAIARTLGNIAIILNTTGSYDSAIAYNKIALNINEKLGKKHSCQLNLSNIANVYFSRRDFQNALKYNQLALRISKETGHQSCKAINFGNIGETYFELAKNAITTNDRASKLAIAIMYLKDAVSLCKEIHYPAPQLEFMKYLKDAYTMAGDHQKALNTFEDYTILKDSIYSSENKNTIAQMEMKRELNIKSLALKIKEDKLRISELELSKKNKERTIYIISILLFAVIFGVVINRLNVSRKSNKKLKGENKQAEDKLVYSEYRLKQAQSIAHIGNWEYNLETGNAVWSEEICRIYGLQPEDTDHSYERWLSFIHPDDIDYIMETITDANKNHRPTGVYHRIVRQDGTIRHLYSESHYEFNEAGVANRIYGIAQDVTELKLNEEHLRKSNERFELVNLATREAILDWDIVKDETFWGNGFTELFGYKPSEYHNHLLSDNMHPEDREKSLAELREALDDPEKKLLFRELRFLKADRSVAYVQIRTVVIRDKAGKAIRAVSSIRDVTNLIINRKALEKQNAALREIAWIQSHVVRSPLASIMGLIELLKHKNEYGIEEEDIIEKIISASDKLNSVIQEVVRKTEAIEHTFQETFKENRTTK